MPLTPRPAGLVGGSATGLLALSGALATQAQLAAAAKEDRAGVEAEGPRGERTVRGGAGGEGLAGCSAQSSELGSARGGERGEPQGPFTPSWPRILGRVLHPPWACIQLVRGRDDPPLARVLGGEGRFRAGKRDLQTVEGCATSVAVGDDTLPHSFFLLSPSLTPNPPVERAPSRVSRVASGD